MKTVINYCGKVIVMILAILLTCCEKSEQRFTPDKTIKQENSASTKSASLDFLSMPPDILVTTASDLTDFDGTNLPGPDGVVSLREAIIAANNIVGPNVIGFNIPTSDPGFDGEVFVIKLISGLPTINSGETFINGSTQSINTSNSNVNGPEIEIDCSLVEDWVPGIDISSNNNRIHGIIINRHIARGQHIRIGGSSLVTKNYVSGCYIGLAKDGISIFPIVDVSGIQVTPGGAFENYIGGITPTERNVISGNMYGIKVDYDSRQTIILGNYIGTDFTGSKKLGNNYGIFIMCDDNIVGSSAKGMGNIISGNSSGIVCHGGGWKLNGNVIEGNFIGTDFSGLNSLPNEWGIHVRPDCEEFLIKNNLISSNLNNGIHFCGYNSSIINNNIGTDIEGKPTLGNGGYGIQVCKDGNTDHGSILIENNNTSANNSGGVTLSGNGVFRKNIVFKNFSTGIMVDNFPSGTHWQISKNLVSENFGLGINLFSEFSIQDVTLNDPGDLDTGPNNLMNFPVLTSAKATPGQLIVKGTIDTPNPKTVTIEFFANPVPVPGGDPTSYGEGAVYLGSVRPNPQGKFTATLPTVAPGILISSTATDAEGNTSEFSANIIAVK